MELLSELDNSTSNQNFINYSLKKTCFFQGMSTAGVNGLDQSFPRIGSLNAEPAVGQGFGLHQPTFLPIDEEVK